MQPALSAAKRRGITHGFRRGTDRRAKSAHAGVKFERLDLARDRRLAQLSAVELSADAQSAEKRWS